jgi:hypothetical protein
MVLEATQMGLISPYWRNAGQDSDRGAPYALGVLLF